MVLIDGSGVDEDGLGVVVWDVDNSERLESTVYIPCSSSTRPFERSMVVQLARGY